MPARVVVLGGGVGGTLAANLLARQLGRDVHVTVVDPTGMHVYQPGFLYAALGRANGWPATSAPCSAGRWSLPSRGPRWSSPTRASCGSPTAAACHLTIFCWPPAPGWSLTRS